jgi:ectoine hydroxylase-related dioxygenase (phytanoyl-CoA dioxygenase family)
MSNASPVTCETTIDKTLHDMGVRPDTLSADERSRLDDDGFLLLRNGLTPSQIDAARRKLDAMIETGDVETPAEEPSGRFVYDLFPKGTEFHPAFTHPKVLAAAAHVLKRSFKVAGSAARCALPGDGLQDLHADSGGPAAGETHGCQSIWLLDDFTPENGATRLVPGTHRLGLTPRDVMDPKAPHPREQLLLAPAGSVLIFNGRLWHAGTRNRSPFARRMFSCFFVHRDQPTQKCDHRGRMPEAMYRSLSSAARYLLDVEGAFA